MAKEKQHGTLAIEDTNQANVHGATDAFADGGIDVSAGFNPKDGRGRQAVSTADVSSGDDGQFNYMDNKYDSAPWNDGKEGEAGERPTLPNIAEPGSIPSPYGKDASHNVDFNAVAPYKYPEFPADSYQTGKNSDFNAGIVD